MRPPGIAIQLDELEYFLPGLYPGVVLAVEGDIADVRARFDTIGIYEALMRSISPLAHATASLAVGSKFPFGN